MDRDRLKEVRRTEQTESRINEDFVEWMKTKGLTWLVVVMVLLVSYILFVRWREGQAAHQNNAWVALGDVRGGLPSAYLSVADQYENVDSVSLLARLGAGRRWLDAVQAGRPLDAIPGQPAELSPEDRDHYLARADEAFRAVLAHDDDSWRVALIMINALNGRAAVAEARDDLDESNRLYLEAAKRAERDFPQLAEQARRRAETIAVMAQARDLPTEAELAAAGSTDEAAAVELDEALRDLLMPNGPLFDFR